MFCYKNGIRQNYVDSESAFLSYFWGNSNSWSEDLVFNLLMWGTWSGHMNSGRLKSIGRALKWR